MNLCISKDEEEGNFTSGENQETIQKQGFMKARDRFQSQSSLSPCPQSSVHGVHQAQLCWKAFWDLFNFRQQEVWGFWHPG